MISVDFALLVHEKLIVAFGGATGVRDETALIGALGRPFQTFDGVELYPTIQEKAAALLESLAVNHPFIDGNKRTAYTLFRWLLENEGIAIRASEEQRYELVIEVSKGGWKQPQILDWMQKHTL